ncbi:amidase [Legionella hackeliae]|uniref:amidase n=1 Tax=Legionella hackeliae TaxID=449 RepID=UPI00072EFE01|nr:amidase [Legionella hackeliae]KTD12673.1 amidase [Legionella hackeliae]
MLLSEYCNLDVSGLSNLIKTKAIKPEEALDCALMRMHEVNPLLNAIVTDCSDWARKQLKQMRGDELFYGVPLLVKDLGFALKGIRYTAGSSFYADTISKQNSDFIERLLALGFLPFAKTNVPELGLSYVTESSLLGPCRNPYNLNCTPGGSSGGSAAAVAAGVAPIATANDGGGSIRIPAACCGLFGFKPTPGLTPVGPWVPQPWSGLASSYVLTRSVQDSVLLFEALTAPTIKEINLRNDRLNEPLPSLRIAVLGGNSFSTVPVNTIFYQAVEEAERELKSCGHHLIKNNLTLEINAIGDCAFVVIAANVCAEIENQQAESGRKAQKSDLEPITWEFVKQGKTITASQLINAKNKLYQLLQPVRDLFKDVDVVLTPSLAQLPITIGQWQNSNFLEYLQKNLEFSPFTSLFNQTGMPAMTLPIMRTENFPISVQFGAAKGHDRLLLRLAQQLSAKFPDFSRPIMRIK